MKRRHNIHQAIGHVLNLYSDKFRATKTHAGTSGTVVTFLTDSGEAPDLVTGTGEITKMTSEVLEEILRKKTGISNITVTFGKYNSRLPFF